MIRCLILALCALIVGCSPAEPVHIVTFVSPHVVSPDVRSAFDHFRRDPRSINVTLAQVNEQALAGNSLLFDKHLLLKVNRRQSGSLTVYEYRGDKAQGLFTTSPDGIFGVLVVADYTVGDYVCFLDPLIEDYGVVHYRIDNDFDVTPNPTSTGGLEPVQ